MALARITSIADLDDALEVLGGWFLLSLGALEYDRAEATVTIPLRIEPGSEAPARIPTALRIFHVARITIDDPAQIDVYVFRDIMVDPDRTRWILRGDPELRIAIDVLRLKAEVYG